MIHYNTKNQACNVCFSCVVHIILGLPGGSVVKNLSVIQETWVQSLGQEDPLEKKMATHSSIISWEIPCAEELSGLQSMRLQESDMTWQ